LNTIDIKTKLYLLKKLNYTEYKKLLFDKDLLKKKFDEYFSLYKKENSKVNTKAINL
jgi:hypothetical protein